MAPYICIYILLYVRIYSTIQYVKAFWHHYNLRSRKQICLGKPTVFRQISFCSRGGEGAFSHPAGNNCGRLAQYDRSLALHWQLAAAVHSYQRLSTRITWRQAPQVSSCNMLLYIATWTCWRQVFWDATHPECRSLSLRMRIGRDTLESSYLGGLFCQFGAW